MNKVKTVFIKPGPDRMLRDLNGNQIGEAGREVVLSPYWQRRINKGDAILGKAKKPTPEPNTEK